MNIISGYAPQTGCSEEEKENFRSELEELIQGVPSGESVIVGADLNCHMGESNTGFEDVHEGKGFGKRNEEGESMLETIERTDMFVANTGFQKKEEHKITYKSGEVCSQVDYILVRRREKWRVRDAKVIPGDCVVAQHRLLVADYKLDHSTKKKREKRDVERIRIWKLAEKREEFREECMREYGEMRGYTQ